MQVPEDIRKPVLQIKMLPEELIELRKELLNHPDIANAAMKGTTFEDCLAEIATKLNIALDGLYDVPDLCKLLLDALRNRNVDRALVPNVPGLQTVELVETDTEISLLPVKDVDWQKEFAHKKDSAGSLPPYTVCGSCKTEFDCCTQRCCGKGIEVQQLGWPVGHSGFIRST